MQSSRNRMETAAAASAVNRAEPFFYFVSFSSLFIFFPSISAILFLEASFRVRWVAVSFFYFLIDGSIICPVNDPWNGRPKMKFCGWRKPHDVLGIQSTMSFFFGRIKETKKKEDLQKKKKNENPLAIGNVFHATTSV